MIDCSHRWHCCVVSVSPWAVRQSFERSGFAVDPLPLDSQGRVQFTIAHRSAGVVTLWLIQFSELAKSVIITHV